MRDEPDPRCKHRRIQRSMIAMTGYDFSDISVLIADDAEPVRDAVVRILETLKVGTILQAADGRVGLEVFIKHRPDIVLADCNMAPVDGLALTKFIRTILDDEQRKVPIILTSGYAAKDYAGKARDAGATEFLAKPFSADDLASRLEYVRLKPRKFIEFEGYTGPDRRRMAPAKYKGPFRRQTDNRH